MTLRSWLTGEHVAAARVEAGLEPDECVSLATDDAQLVLDVLHEAGSIVACVRPRSVETAKRLREVHESIIEARTILSRSIVEKREEH